LAWASCVCCTRSSFGGAVWLLSVPVGLVSVMRFSSSQRAVSRLKSGGLKRNRRSAPPCQRKVTPSVAEAAFRARGVHARGGGLSGSSTICGRRTIPRRQCRTIRTRNPKNENEASVKVLAGHRAVRLHAALVAGRWNEGSPSGPPAGERVRGGPEGSDRSRVRLLRGEIRRTAR
jgi:hypothetical protein